MTQDLTENTTTMQPQQSQLTREQFIDQLFQIKKEDNYLRGKKSRDKAIQGITKGLEVLSDSYGPNGTDVDIKSNLYPFNESTKDGKKILDSIKLSDPYEMQGFEHMKEASNETDKEVGDGRKTTAILLAGIAIEGAKHDFNPNTLRKEFTECLPILIDSIDEQTVKIDSKEVAKVAANASDSEELGKIFSDIYSKIGSDGIIEIENSGLSDTYYEITEGVKLLGCKFQYDYMAESEEGRKAIRNNPRILITKEKITSINQLNPVLKWMNQQSLTDFVIFCDEIENSVSSMLYEFHKGFINGGSEVKFNILVIKAPVLWKDWIFEDFARITSSTIIDGITTKLKDLKPTHLGLCTKITTDKHDTIVYGTNDISEHIKKILEDNNDNAKIRASRLKTKTAVLKLGANSETELSRLRGKALDGRNSAFHALQGGVVKGAGISLIEASKKLPNNTAGEILKSALKYPNKIINESKTNVYDASIVIKAVITHAISIGLGILTRNTISLN